MRISDWSSDVCSSDLAISCSGAILTMHSFLMTTAWPDTGSSMEPFKRTAPLISVVVECDVVLDMLNPPNRFHPDMAILISGLAKIRTKYRLVVHELCRRTLCNDFAVALGRASCRGRVVQ